MLALVGGGRGLYMLAEPSPVCGDTEPDVPNNTTIVQEMTSAGRGVMALIVGNRRAAEYFDFSDRGLVGSFIALLAVSGVNALLPTLLGTHSPAGSVFRAMAMIAILLAFQVGFSALVLRQLNRLDGLVPYLVADNWATFFVTIGLTALALAGFTGELALIAVAILILVIEVNIARLIVTLPLLQIIMFIIARMVGVSIGLIVVSVLMPLPPEVVEALAAQ